LNSLAMVFRTAMALAIGLATNSLLRPVGGGLKQLLTVAAAANGRQGPALLRLPLSKLLHLLNPFRVCFRVRTAFPDGGFKTMAFSLARMTYFLPGTDTELPANRFNAQSQPLEEIKERVFTTSQTRKPIPAVISAILSRSVTANRISGRESPFGSCSSEACAPRALGLGLLRR
jgi:hypothetical protein